MAAIRITAGWAISFAIGARPRSKPGPTSGTRPTPQILPEKTSSDRATFLARFFFGYRYGFVFSL